MKEDSKKVIMVDGKTSEWYEKAIFIMRSDINIDNKPIDFVTEAEKIINAYMMKTTLTLNEIKSKPKQTKFNSDKKFDIVLNTCLVFSIFILAITIYKLCI